VSALNAACVLVLAAVHLGAGALRFLEGPARSRWLSAAGGVAVAYVFVHLLPDVAEAGEAIEESGFLGAIERHAYVMALLGLVAFYSLEHMAILARRRRMQTHGEDRADMPTLWVHVASYGAYNALVGYLVAHRPDGEARSLLLFTVAIGLHYVIADFGLREHHREDYDRVVRWVLAGAIAAGFVLGSFTELSEATIGLMLAFLAGAVVVNTLKEEVPGDRGSRLLPFVLGAAAYAALLLAL
jgi:zinc transporter ZupT